MDSIKELRREAAPGGRPQPLAYANGSLYVGSLDTKTIYEIAVDTWAVRSQWAAPGKPFGMAPLGDAIRVVVSIGEEDDRYLHTFVPGKGFTGEGVALPDLSGSHLASDGTQLYLLQIGNRRIVTLDADGAARKQTALPGRLGGVGCANGELFGLAGDEEFEHLHLARIDVSGTEATFENVASISDDARALTHDGRAWWTSYRDLNEIVSFNT